MNPLRNRGCCMILWSGMSSDKWGQRGKRRGGRRVWEGGEGVSRRSDRGGEIAAEEGTWIERPRFSLSDSLYNWMWKGRRRRRSEGKKRQVDFIHTWRRMTTKRKGRSRVEWPRIKEEKRRRRRRRGRRGREDTIGCSSRIEAYDWLQLLSSHSSDA